MRTDLEIDALLAKDNAQSYVFFKFDEVVYGYVALENRVKAESPEVVR